MIYDVDRKISEVPNHFPAYYDNNALLKQQGISINGIS